MFNQVGQQVNRVKQVHRDKIVNNRAEDKSCQKESD